MVGAAHARRGTCRDRHPGAARPIAHHPGRRGPAGPGRAAHDDHGAAGGGVRAGQPAGGVVAAPRRARGGAGSLAIASAEASQASSLLLGGSQALIGPEPYQAAADLRAGVDERTMVMAANRLIAIALVVIVLGSILALAGIGDPGDLLGGAGRG